MSLRKEYEKHFLLSDGSYQVALYNEPIHKMENGQWVEIDNTLALRSTRDGPSEYVTANGLADVSFSQNFGDRLVTIRQGDYSLTWGLRVFPGGVSSKAAAQRNRSVQAELVTSDISAFSANEQKTLAAKSSSTIQYRNALAPNVDLEYIVLPSRVKENIILQSKQDISYYTVTVFAENLTARILENREIEYYNDSGESVFTMTSPYMYDSAGELTENITVELVSKGNGCYEIKMTPDAQWLGSADRVYPVVLDPQVSVDTTRTNIIDNYVLEGSGNQNRNLDRLYIGKKSGKTARAYIKYATMPTLPADAEITGATMFLTMVSGTSTAANASAYKVTGGDWASDTITWANKPTLNTLLLANISHNNKTGYSFSCRTAVQSWYQDNTTGSRYNYGFMLRYYDETIADYNAIYSADCSSASKRPSLTISYNGSDDGPNFDSAENIALDIKKYVGTISSNQEKYYKFVPPASAEYLFFSSGASVDGDPYITIYSSSGTVIASNDNSGGNKNFRLSVALSKGSTYYIGVKHTGGKSGLFYLNILIECIAEEEIVCHLRNTYSSYYLDLDDPDYPEYAYQWSYNGSASAQWAIQRESGGYYTIKSKTDDGCYLGVDNADIDLFYSVSDRTRWKIYVKSTGEMFIEPKSAEGKVLYVPNNSIGSELQLSDISSNVSDRSKWKIECVSDTSVEGQQRSNWCWVTAARMFAKHYSGDVSLTQEQVVNLVKNDPTNNDPGTTEDVKRAIEYLLEDTDVAPLELNDNPGGSNGRIFPEDVLRHFIDDGHVVLAARDWYNGTEKDNGHAILIVGYTGIFENGELQFRYTINDPWPAGVLDAWKGLQNTEGQSYEKSYVWICNGQHEPDINQRDTGIWVGFVAVDTDYDIVCLPEMNKPDSDE